MSGVCKKGKTPLWPEGVKRRNEEFKPKVHLCCRPGVSAVFHERVAARNQTKKDKETEDLMASLRGMPGMDGQGLSLMTGDELDLGEDAGDGLKDEI